MAAARGIGEKIKELSKSGKSNSEIHHILKCSRGTVIYHLTEKGKIWAKLSYAKHKAKYPFHHKYNKFCGRKIKPKKTKYPPKDLRAALVRRLITFFSNGRQYENKIRL